MKWWIKYSSYFVFISAITWPFIAAGPVAIISNWFGYDFAGIESNETSSSGAWICAIISIFCIVVMVRAYIVPWCGNDGIYWESGPYFTKGDKDA